jgi:hypothetical protein
MSLLKSGSILEKKKKIKKIMKTKKNESNPGQPCSGKGKDESHYMIID